MLELDIAPLAYEQVDADWLPGKRPYRYQQRAFESIREAFDKRETLCLFLVTPTGSGKTLASHAYSLRTGAPILGVYPTNELIADQQRALEPEYKQVLGWPEWVYQIDSRTLDSIQEERVYKAHSETLEAVLNWRRVILTNPDILFYIAFGRYANQRFPSIEKRLYRLVADIYRIIVFDEFHLYNTKQVADIAFLVGALSRLNPDRPYVFIFASATPDDEVVNLLRERAGLRVVQIQAEALQDTNARIIAHPVHLAIAPADLDRWQGLTALDESFSIVDEFLTEFPRGRVVAIFGSVAGAIEAARRFRERYPSVSVGEVHGLSSDAQREAALLEQITIGTATIEVGVDFKGEREKDFLIFEARTSSQFLQRFGRIARHAKSLPIPNRALALVPPYVYHFLNDRFADARDVTRDELRQAIEEAYRVPEQFKGFLKKHAAIEMRVATTLLGSMFQPDVRPRVMPRIDDLIEKLTEHSAGLAWRKYRQAKEQGIVAPLLDFRGNQLQAAIWDVRGTDVGFPAKEYDLMFVLRRGIFQEMTEEEYCRELERLEQEVPEWKTEIGRAKRNAKLIETSSKHLLGVYGFFRVTGLTEQARRVWFEIREENIIGCKCQVTVVEGLSIVTEPSVPLHSVNRLLRRKQIVAWFIDAHPTSIRLGRALPPLFEVYPLRIVRPGGGTSDKVWSVAFNQNAFFLDSLWWRESRTGEVLII